MHTTARHSYFSPSHDSCTHQLASDMHQCLKLPRLLLLWLVPETCQTSMSAWLVFEWLHLHWISRQPAIYRIALNFQGRKLSWFLWFWMESQKFFHEYLVTWGKNEEMFTTLQKFYYKIFILEQNSRNHESFMPWKSDAI